MLVAELFVSEEPQPLIKPIVYSIVDSLTNFSVLFSSRKFHKTYKFESVSEQTILQPTINSS